MTDQVKFFRKLNGVFRQLTNEHKYMRTVATTNRRLSESASSELEAELDKINQMFTAARKGLGIVNKLPYGDSKLKHTRRVMGNLNRIRGSLQRLEKQIAQSLNTNP